MKQRLYIRPTISIVMLFIGVFIANLAIPEEFEFSTKLLILIIAGGAFALLGFILPEFVTLIAKAGIEEIAKQIVRRFPSGGGGLANFAGPIGFGRRKKVKSTKYLNPIVVDTSVLIDGRLGDIAKSGFISGELIILPSVLGELHMLSDSRDDLKRARGRRGLDILEEIKKVKKTKVNVLDSEPQDTKVDNKLISMAKSLKAAILTVDFNLGKVARVQGITVLNINDLANAVKTVTLPGEELKVLIGAAGKGKDQGVGFLDDGTMVVVENGAGFVGQILDVKVNKILQTSAGKMIFARKAS